jgi:hypothetical protein
MTCLWCPERRASSVARVPSSSRWAITAPWRRVSSPWPASSSRAYSWSCTASDETFKVKQTGVTHQAEWAWVYEVHDGLITRILAIEDLSGIEEPVREVVASAQSGSG